MPSTVDMDDFCRYAHVVNNNDSEVILDSLWTGVKYTLAPKGYCVIHWDASDPYETSDPPVSFSTGDMEVSVAFSNDDLRENKRIVIFGDLVNSPSCRMTPRTNPRDIKYRGTPKDSSWLSVDEFLRTMGELEKKVRIWHNQCKHLLKKCREAVDRVKIVSDSLKKRNLFERDLEIFCLEIGNHLTSVTHGFFPLSRDSILCSALISSMLEGKALLLSCGESSYNEAAFALTAAPPRVPTFSKFALAIRELAWNVEFLVFVRCSGSLDSWEWCEERGRVVLSDFPHRLDASDDDTLEADVRRQNADREALRSSLDLKLGKSPGTSSFKFLKPATWRAGASAQGELESIWRKRLQASSCAPGSFSPHDAFVIDNPETTFVQVPRFTSRGGSSKSVQKYKWLGQTVALSAMSKVSKVSAQAETGFLASVQHPNVVEWMGYAFQEDIRDPSRYRECFLVTEYMEWDLEDLITQLLTGDDGKLIENRPPFEIWIALDIALQIVEAMIHLHKCRVLHRDLKPKNILASQRYSMLNGILFYTVKLIDFGASKSGDQGSYFHTRKQGTSVYMAPEVWESEESYSWSADVYSFGLTCFEIFTGRLPLEDGMARTHANIQKVLRGEILFPDWCPVELQSLILKCCAQRPSDRPSFEDIRKDLWRLKVLYRSDGRSLEDIGKVLGLFEALVKGKFIA